MPKQTTKLVDKKLYAKWYNYAKETLNNDFLIPARTDIEIFDIVSQENWLIFCQKGDTKKIAIQKEDPNVFFDILSKEGNLEGFGRLGLTFNNLKAYNKFKTIMQGYNKEIKNKITHKLLTLKKEWEINISRKIKENHPSQTPKYYREHDWHWNTRQINDNIIDEIIKLGEEIRTQGVKNREIKREEAKNPKKFYVETPSINLMDFTFPLNKQEFSERILEIFDVLSLCLNVKTDLEIKRLKREKSNELKEKQELLMAKEHHLRDIETLEKIFPQKVKKEDKDKLISEIAELKKQIELLLSSST